jgi:hypothetical protein
MTATARDHMLRDLTASHVAAATVLLGGGTHAEAADAAGVHRVTVIRWAHQHAAFIAHMNQGKPASQAAPWAGSTA